MQHLTAPKNVSFTGLNLHTSKFIILQTIRQWAKSTVKMLHFSKWQNAMPTEDPSNNWLWSTSYPQIGQLSSHTLGEIVTGAVTEYQLAYLWI